MKILTIIVHTDSQKKLTDLLRTMKQVPGYTFTQVEGHGAETENDPFLSARDDVVGYVPRLRTDILLENSDVDSILEKLRDKETGLAGQGVFWVTAVEVGDHL